MYLLSYHNRYSLRVGVVRYQTTCFVLFPYFRSLWHNEGHTASYRAGYTNFFYQYRLVCEYTMVARQLFSV